MSRFCELTGKGVGTGHSVSHSNIKTKRVVAPNLVSARLVSDLLKKIVKVKIAASTLRTIDYFGGFDQYLLRTRKAKLTTYAKKLKKLVGEKQEESSSDK